MSTRVSIVEDDSGLRASLADLIANEAGFACASTHANAEDALREIPRVEPDVLVVDINLPKKSGIECVRELKARCPKIQILMLTVYNDSKKIFESLRAGASGYLVKRTPSAEILEAIRQVHLGGSPMSAQVARMVVNSFFQEKQGAPALPKLSPREEEVLTLVSEGARSKEIAGQLGISITTVHTHLKHIYEKLHVRSRVEAAAKFLKPR